MKNLILAVSLVISAVSQGTQQPQKCPNISGHWFCHDLGMPRDEDETSYFKDIALEQLKCTPELRIIEVSTNRELKLVEPNHLHINYLHVAPEFAHTQECARVPAGTGLRNVYLLDLPWH